MSKIKVSAIRKLLLFRKLFNKERKSVIKLALTKKWYCWTKGFLSESYVIYDFKTNSHKNYLPDYNRFILAPFISARFGNILDNKLIFSLLFSEHVQVPPLWGYIDQGRYTCIQNQISLLDATAFYAQAVAAKGIVCKPLAGGGGRGVMVFDCYNDKIYYKQQALTAETLQSKLLGLNDYIVNKRIYQSEFAAHFNPSSINTLRILTMVSPDLGEPFIATAVFRMGSKRSGLVDNWSSGGLSAAVNLSTGTLSAAVTFPYQGKLAWHSQHPDSNVAIENVKIPNWEKIQTKLLAIAKQFNYIPYVGWDVVMLEDDILILEGNTNSDVNLLQVHGPLLQNEKVKQFYKHYGVI